MYIPCILYVHKIECCIYHAYYVCIHHAYYAYIFILCILCLHTFEIMTLENCLHLSQHQMIFIWNIKILFEMFFRKIKFTFLQLNLDSMINWCRGLSFACFHFSLEKIFIFLIYMGYHWLRNNSPTWCTIIKVFFQN